ncbi:hypothetical protein [Persephonella sp.]
MTDIIKEILLEMAKQKKLITYSQLAVQVNKLSNEKIPEKGKGLGSVLSKHLHKICSQCYMEGKGLLGSIVVTKKTGMPSEGYFKFASNLYGLKLKTEEEKISFWKNELRKVFEEAEN